MKKIFVIAAAAMMGLAWTVAAKADTTFAQFVDLGGAPFTFSDTGPGSTFEGTTQGYITFLYPGALQGQQLANITLTSTAVSPAQAVFGLLAQPIDGVTNTLSFTRPSDGANLLTVTFTGDLVGFDGDVSASLSSTATTFTSQFLSFAGAGAEGAQINTSAMNPDFSLDGDDGFANTFTADLTGAFTTANVPLDIPEPSTWAMLAMGGACLFVTLRRRGVKA